MSTNPWFADHYYQPEDDMIDLLKEEAIQIKGVNVYYILRDMLDRDYLYGESKISEFKDLIEIEMYLESIQSHNGSADLYEKFGLTLTDQATFEVHARRFKEESVSYDLDRPREGDLIYLRPADQLYEIKKVRKTEEFYQLGKNYTYLLDCTLFVYSHEKLLEDDFEEVESFNLKSIIDTANNTITVNEDNLNETSKELEEEVTINNLIKPKNTNQ